MSEAMHGKTVLVTGAAQGVGRAIALDIARAGAEALILCDRQQDRGEAVAAEIRAIGAESVFVHADLAEADAPALILEQAIARFGHIDSLVNAAGVTDRATVAEATPALWERVFAINARAPMFLMQAVIRHLRERQAPGTILNILSMNAYGGTAELAIYAASKAALALLTRNAAHAHRFDRIRINGINLGWVDTPAERQTQAVTMGLGDGWLAEANAKQPNGRLLVPEDVARLALFLLGDASFPMTGSLVDQEQWVLSIRD
jgi:NAD(P)-dependent dehydrogenase (short-subunit alcohol dehydrogenase family)